MVSEPDNFYFVKSIGSVLDISVIFPASARGPNLYNLQGRAFMYYEKTISLVEREPGNYILVRDDCVEDKKDSIKTGERG
jgi:hypothetical protein